MIAFNGGSYSDLTFGSNGSLSGEISIASINGQAANAYVYINLTGATSDGSGGYSYSGGVFDVEGNFADISNEELLLSGILPSGIDLKYLGQTSPFSGVSEYGLTASFTDGTIAADLAADENQMANSIVSGTFSVGFDQYPELGPMNAYSTIVANGFAVPEPNSAILATIGLLGMAVLTMIRTRKARWLSGLFQS
jgi:hypothetical protein